MGKKRMIPCIVFLLLVVLVVGIHFMVTSDKYIIAKGYRIFGNQECPKETSDFYSDDRHPTFQLTVITSYTCKLCHTKEEHSTSPSPVICSNCSQVTQRCAFCGKLLKNENS